MSHQIEINIKNFRAIHQANIGLDGITVVTGENGCGKSTISKLLYQTYKVANQYDDYVLNQLNQSLKSPKELIEEVIEVLEPMSEITYDDGSQIEVQELLSYNLTIDTSADTEKFRQNIQIIIYKLKTYTDELTNESKRLLESIKGKKNNDELTGADFVALLDEMLAEMLAKIDAADDMMQKRPISILHEEIKKVFSTSKLPEEFEVLPSVNISKDRLQKSFLVKEQVYVDTPMSAGLNMLNTKYSHWGDLNNLLRKIPEYETTASFVPQYMDEIMGGSVEHDFVKEVGFFRGFLYQRKDGLTINLLDCATGLKSFAILQLLYKNGTLRKDTLVIIDEPEAHLHPQWVVEYARLIVVLNKEIGTKFFIASHHPDMIAAIKYIMEKENVSDNLNFYLAEKIGEQEHSYDYKHLGTNIEPIFASFNIALDRISQYGGGDNNE